VLQIKPLRGLGFLTGRPNWHCYQADVGDLFHNAQRPGRVGLRHRVKSHRVGSGQTWPSSVSNFGTTAIPSIRDSAIAQGPTSHAPQTYGPLWANMTSSTKSQIQNGLRCRRKRTEPRLYSQRVQQWSLRYASGQTDIRTDTLTAILRTPTGGRSKNKVRLENVSIAEPLQNRQHAQNH